jgi:hypothetical protein
MTCEKMKGQILVFILIYYNKKTQLMYMWNLY